MCNCGNCNCGKGSIAIPKGPKGNPGPAGTISVGTVTTLAPGEDVTVSNSGTSTAAVLNFGIPEGEPGDSTPGGIIVADSIPSSVPFGGDLGPELTVPTTLMTVNGSTVEIDIAVSITGATSLEIINAGSGSPVFAPIALPTEDTQYRFAITLSLVRVGTSLNGYIRIIGTRVNELGTDVVIENVGLTSVNFAADQTYLFSFTAASSSDDTLFALVKLFNPIV